jgi:aminopeptidase-like protein
MDDLNRLNISNIVDMVNVLEDVYDRICNARVFFRKQPNGELFLSKHGLYPQNGVENRITSELREAILWLLNLSDGKHSFEKIIKLSNCQEKVMNEAVRLCVEKGLIQKLT